jgi:RNA polymerase sigma-70 factor (ECF subfamily)
MGQTTEPGSQSDAELVAAYQAGNERAATELVTRHARAVARYLYGAGAADEEVDDLAQEAFFKAFRKLDTWRGDAAFRSWLITIAGNLLKDAHRRRAGRTMVSIEERDIPDHVDPEGELAAHEAQDRLQECLRLLPRLQRDVFLLRVQQGAEYAEIARALETTPGAARVHYHHAVKRLKESIR